ncbi:MAG TPA: AAA family ATPase [Burkholderiaceae bacterium]
MPKSTPRYAKLSRPRLHGMVVRERLHGLLETLCERSAVVWLAGPAGAGKSFLTASYLADVPANAAIWYQLDVDDCNPATLFYFLAAAVPHAALPPPDSAADAGAQFARRFFREFYAALEADTVVVFDNAHELLNPAGLPLLEAACGEVPDGITLLLLSREPLHPSLEKLELGGKLQRLSWDALRFTAHEAQSLLGQAGAAIPDQPYWLDRIDGWAAGLAILRDQVVGAGADTEAGMANARVRMFRYFSGEILDRMAAEQRRLLMLLSCLSSLSESDALQLTGDPQGAALLSHLAQRRWLVERRGGAQGAYHFNSLFRDFLQAAAEQGLEPADRAAMLKNAAAIVNSRGSIAEAARMYKDAGAEPSLASLLLRCAWDMIREGAGQTWIEWTEWLSPETVAALPYLQYWRGMATLHVDAAMARLVLTKAERGFDAQDDLRGRMLVLAAIMDSYYYEWENFVQVRGWLDSMLAVRARGGPGAGRGNRAAVLLAPDPGAVPGGTGIAAIEALLGALAGTACERDGSVASAERGGGAAAASELGRRGASARDGGALQSRGR